MHFELISAAGDDLDKVHGDVDSTFKRGKDGYGKRDRKLEMGASNMFTDELDCSPTCAERPRLSNCEAANGLVAFGHCRTRRWPRSSATDKAVKLSPYSTGARTAA